MVEFVLRLWPFMMGVVLGWGLAEILHCTDDLVRRHFTVMAATLLAFFAFLAVVGFALVLWRELAWRGMW